VETPLFEPYVVPIAVVILLLCSLSAVRHASRRRVVRADHAGVVRDDRTLGIVWIVRAPVVLAALNPVHAVRFSRRTASPASWCSGGRPRGDRSRSAVRRHGPFRQEADSARVVHHRVSRARAELLRPGRTAPDRQRRARQPFFLLVPSWGLLPMVAIATAAAIIASQALISGAFSLTQQAIQLGYVPRLDIEHTSSSEMGQIYVPQVNWALMVATIVIVIGFESSSALAAAYGIAGDDDDGHHDHPVVRGRDGTVALVQAGGLRRRRDLPDRSTSRSSGRTS
jgi:KUP system potassium uptake protein